MDNNQSKITEVINQLVETKMKDPHNKVKIQNLQQLLDKLTEGARYVQNGLKDPQRRIGL